MELQTKNHAGIFVSVAKQNVSYPSHGNDYCFAIEKNSFWFNHRNNVIKEILLKFPYANNFADIGGGNGYQANFIRNNFPEKEVFLIEPGYEGCINARKYGLENVYNIPFQEFDFKSNHISGIGLFDVVEHIENDVDFLTEIASCCDKGTNIYITVPAHNSLWSDIDNYSGHYRRYNSKMIEILAKKTDLKLLYNGYFFSYLTLPVYLIRSMPYKIMGKRDSKVILEKSSKNHKSGTLTKGLVNLLNNMELTALRNLKKIPLGGSCIAVFQVQ